MATSFRDIDPTQLEYSPPITRKTKAGKDAGKYTQVTHKGGRPILFQTPPMSLPFGISEHRNDQSGGYTDYKASLSFTNVLFNLATKKFAANSKGQPELDEERLAFFEWCAALDDANLNAMFENQEEWFERPGKKNPLEAVRALYYPVLRKDTPAILDGTYSPLLNTKLRRPGTSKSTLIYNAANEPLSLEAAVELTQARPKTRYNCVAILEITGFWIAARQFGMTMFVRELMLIPSVEERASVGTSIRLTGVAETMRASAEEYLKETASLKRQREEDGEEDVAESKDLAEGGVGLSNFNLAESAGTATATA